MNFFAKISKPQNWKRKEKKKTPSPPNTGVTQKIKKSETPTHHTKSLYREEGAFMQGITLKCPKVRCIYSSNKLQGHHHTGI